MHSCENCRKNLHCTIHRAMARTFLTTARLRLREFTLKDVDHVVALDADPEVMRYVSFGVPTPHAAVAEKILPAWISYYALDRRIGWWAAELLSTGEFIGWLHLRPDRFVPAELELGYRFARRYWNQGFATEG